jgi:group I intron endonuclease
MGIIYLIKNKINNKCYIGQTIRTLNIRWREHCNRCDNCTILNNAIQKYTPDMFDVSIIVNCDDQLDQLEQKYIIEYNSLYPNGYNIQSGGSKGRFHCDES